MTNASALAELSDRELLVRVHEAAHHERLAIAALISMLMELDTRRLYLGEGCSSLFTYCTQVLHLSEHAAYNRIETARAARRFPVILELVQSAAVTLTSVRLLAPHLTDDNHRDILERARYKSKREIERALGLLLEQLERTRAAKTTRPRAGCQSKPDSRHIPAAVKRAVWQRDNGRCAFKGKHGRCTETGFLEYHHIVPYAEGGQTSSSNLELRCRAHNQYEADLWFGASMAREARAIFGARSNSFRNEFAPCYPAVSLGKAR